jgi:hypothetical protein
VLEPSYDLAGRDGAGLLRARNQSWVGLAALEWRALTWSGHDELIAGIAAVLGGLLPGAAVRENS